MKKETRNKARYQNSSNKSSWRQTVPFYKERNSIPENITLILTVLILPGTKTTLPPLESTLFPVSSNVIHVREIYERII